MQGWTRLISSHMEVMGPRANSKAQPTEELAREEKFVRRGEASVACVNCFSQDSKAISVIESVTASRGPMLQRLLRTHQLLCGAPSALPTQMRCVKQNRSADECWTPWEKLGMKLGA